MIAMAAGGTGVILFALASYAAVSKRDLQRHGQTCSLASSSSCWPVSPQHLLPHPCAALGDFGRRSGTSRPADPFRHQPHRGKVARPITSAPPSLSISTSTTFCQALVLIMALQANALNQYSSGFRRLHEACPNLSAAFLLNPGIVTQLTRKQCLVHRFRAMSSRYRATHLQDAHAKPRRPGARIPRPRSGRQSAQASWLTALTVI